MMVDESADAALAAVRFWWRVSMTVAAVTLCVIVVAVALLFAGALD